MKIDFDMQKNTIDGRVTISTPADILQYVSDEKNLYVLLDHKQFGAPENILCYNNDGKLIWQVEEVFKMEGDNYFTVLGMQDNVLYAYNVNGIKVTIDSKTGRFLTKILAK